MSTSTKVSQLHQQSSLRLQNLQQSGAKTNLCHFNYETKPFALLRRSPSPDGDVTRAWVNCWELARHGKDCQMGTRAYGAQHYVCPTNGNQVPGIGRFHGRMNRNIAAASPSYLGALEHVLR
jgi:hypothetical protein